MGKAPQIHCSEHWDRTLRARPHGNNLLFLLVLPSCWFHQERDQVGSSFEYTCIRKVWHACRQSRLECLRSSLSSGIGCGSGQGAREPYKQSAKHLSVVHCRFTEVGSTEQRGWEGGLFVIPCCLELAEEGQVMISGDWLVSGFIWSGWVSWATVEFSLGLSHAVTFTTASSTAVCRSKGLMPAIMSQRRHWSVLTTSLH